MAKGTIVHNMTALGNQKCHPLPPQTAQEFMCAGVVHLETETCRFSFQEEVHDTVETLQCAVVVFLEGKRHISNCTHCPI